MKTLVTQFRLAAVMMTLVFAGAVIVVAAVARWRTVRNDDQETPRTDEGSPATSSWPTRILCFIMLALAGGLAATWLCTAHWTHGPLPGRIAERFGDLGGRAQPNGLPPATVLYPRLFTGGTVYRYVAGSRSWFEWPLPAELDGGGLDVGLFWIAIFGSAWLLGRSWRFTGDRRLRLRNRTDVVLLAAWALQLVAFLAVAGPQAMAPGWERFTLGLIGPAVLLLSRGATRAWEAASTPWRVVLATATLAGWPLLADFHAQYFRFIERTGGQSHLTFRTAAVEPKQAALQYILDDARGLGQREMRKGEAGRPKAELWIVCSEWWNRWPIRYLAMPDHTIHVPEPKEIDASDDYQRALAEGRVWFIEFYNSEAQRQVESRLADRAVTRRQFLDYGGRPLLMVFHAAPR